MSHCLKGVIVRRYCSSHDRICFSVLLAMLHVPLLNRALIADEPSQGRIFFLDVPGVRRLRTLVQKHLSVCASLCVMLVFVFPSLSISSLRICVFSTVGIVAMVLSAM